LLLLQTSDGEWILELRGLGCQGLGIPVGKLALYTALGGFHPSACLLITLDTDTNNEELFTDDFYMSLRHRRAMGQVGHLHLFLHVFMSFSSCKL